MEQFFLKNSPWIFLLYIIVKELFPLLRSISDKLIPARIDRMKSIEERRDELDEQRLDLREREAIAMENIGTSLTILKMNHDQFSEETKIIMVGIEAANRGIMVLLDRRGYKRKESDTDRKIRALRKEDIDNDRQKGEIK